MSAFSYWQQFFLHSGITESQAEKYAHTFAVNGITEESMQTWSIQTLRELGISDVSYSFQEHYYPGCTYY